ncbi:MAG: translocation/assembly module TamB, partial [Sinomicrobium sp.]|nr:translocation/assembly module TamB [Sinomicrobium sp.]
HQNEQINLTGKLIDSAYKDIKLQFKDVSLNKITPVVEGFSLSGLINGSLNILQDNGVYLPSSNLTVSNFTVNENHLGDLAVEIAGKDNLSRYDVDIDIVNNDVESLNVAGSIRVNGDSPVMDIQASLRNLNMELFSPLGEDVISDIRGYASGDVTLSGPLKNPAMNGALKLENAGMKIPYLNVDGSFDNTTRINLYGQTFELNDAVIFDTQYHTRALLNGTISHVNFKEWYLDLNLDTRGNRFLVLNTKESEDALYYGTGFMNGTGDIFGYTDQLNIRVNAATAAGTSLKIPISEVTSVGDVSFINFINKNEKDTLSGKRELLEYKGLELDFDLDVTPEAEVEIVIDKRSGSTLKGTGAGNLLIEINTNGKFRMWGDFITYTGTYNFKYGGVIDKKFKVLPGGTIAWEGDPFNANIDMKAVYSLYANPGVLLENNDFTRKVATDVEIQLAGNLEQIDPDFAIRFPGMNSVRNAELQYRLEEKDKRQLQALSLLSQGAFISEVSITQQALTGNLIETASGLVNEILNDSDGKFDIGLSYEQGGRNPDSQLQLEDRVGVTISTQISDRILVNGKIGVPVGGVTETVVAGDVEVQVLLNEDGSLSAKIFNKENEILRQF